MGKAQVLFFPLLFFHAFQIVLFYLFGEDVIAADMLLNVVTTNSSEVGELLGALLPSIIIVVLLYVPPTVLGIIQWKNKIRLSKRYRVKIRKLGLGILILAILCSFFGKNLNTGQFSYHKEIYPVNLFYNIVFASQKFYKINHYPETSKSFTFKANRLTQTNHRQIIVLVVGETSRPLNWSLFGYERNTNPQLSQIDSLLVFPDVLTQSNVTHESVPIILSAVGAENFKDLYHQKGIFAPFQEVGFTTICLSNQAENASFIEHIYKQADIYENLKNTDYRAEKIPNKMDVELTKLLEEKIKTIPGDLFVVLHSYGSHFNYKDRYPKDFAKYTPDEVTNVSKKQRAEMINAYDNSIRYTDYFLSETIKVLQQSEASAFLLYTADHGEDIFDDSRGKFLHSSPTPTYYQLRTAFLTWYSDAFAADFPQEIRQLKDNRLKAFSTNAVFHTLLDAGQIESPYYQPDLSLFSRFFKEKERVFLTDHENAIPVRQLNLKDEDFDQFKKHHIKL